jgi:hypothetical protein
MFQQLAQIQLAMSDPTQRAQIINQLPQSLHYLFDNNQRFQQLGQDKIAQLLDALNCVQSGRPVPQLPWLDELKAQIPQKAEVVD